MNSLSLLRKQVVASTTSTYSIKRVLSSAAVPVIKAPVLFKYDEIIKKVVPSLGLIKEVENAFSLLSKNEVEVPIPMHIGIKETSSAGPGDCHIKGGYIENTTTFTVKLANVSFYKNLQRGMSPGSGVFIVCSAVNGLPLGIFQENRYLTDMRTGAAGAIAVKHLVKKDADSISFIGVGAIAKVMAHSSSIVHKFKQGHCYGINEKECIAFADSMSKIVGYPIKACTNLKDAIVNADVIFTQTPAATPVPIEVSMLKKHALIIASGSDQSTKNEIPVVVMQSCSKFVTDLTRQCIRVGELRSLVKANAARTGSTDAMDASSVYCELGDITSGKMKGREPSDGVILVDLTGTGAQDAAIGQYAWDIMKDE